MTKRCNARFLARPEAGLRAPSGLVLWQGNLLVADMDNQRVARLLSGGAVSDFGTGMPSFAKPLALASSANSLWVADAGKPALWRWQAGEWSRLVTPESLLDGLSLPGSVALTDAGQLYFTDFLKNRVCCRTLRGDCKVVDSIYCTKPYGICTQGDALYITDTGSGRILRYSIHEDKCSVLLEQGKDWNPIALAVSSDDWLYISTGRTLYRTYPMLGGLEKVVDSASWRAMGLGKLCHLGAIVAEPGRVVVADTIRHIVVELFPIS